MIGVYLYEKLELVAFCRKYISYKKQPTVNVPQFFLFHTAILFVFDIGDVYR